MRLPGWFFDTPCVLMPSGANDPVTGEPLIDEAQVFRGMCMLSERGASAVKAEALEGVLKAKALLQDVRAEDIQRFSNGLCRLEVRGEAACVMRIACVRRMRVPGARELYVALELVECG